jgi:hypothetical protein
LETGRFEPGLAVEKEPEAEQVAEKPAAEHIPAGGKPTAAAVSGGKPEEPGYTLHEERPNRQSVPPAGPEDTEIAVAVESGLPEP